ncbi:hypothetical protein P691DRAFT_755414 [Macrolepiota fuliginosa MF-IS2]|uniref:Uncharacterized protein n=1 Tax=Macrolepiota fuliginosa MF-IS2 TaxID=1400762 RepID=A0A9P6C622_9AGAR|nr:hypothetical protein P691DRAFT_755414 [Macrolepiota fuliginosa MF-IS2]
MTAISPHLPQELVEEIIAQAWGLQLSANERILLMTSLPLVSRSVLGAYIRISSIDIHIPSSSYAETFLQTLREGAPRYPTPRTMSAAADLCSSISFEIVQRNPTLRAKHWSTEPPMGVVLSDLLYSLRLFGDLPNFRTLTIRYVDVDINDIFDWARFIDFPRTVEWLVLEYRQTEVDVPQPKIIITPPPPSRSPHISLWTLPFLKHLRVSGGSEEVVSRLASSAPNLKTLRHDVGR